MTTINNKNYETFALDYIEGTLSDNERHAFEGFLSDNEEIQREILELKESMPILQIPQITYPDKKNLLKQPDKTPLRRIITTITAVAAVLALGLIVTLRQTPASESVIASHDVANIEPKIVEPTPADPIIAEQGSSKAILAQNTKQSVAAKTESTAASSEGEKAAQTANNANEIAADESKKVTQSETQAELILPSEPLASTDLVPSVIAEIPASKTTVARDTSLSLQLLMAEREIMQSNIEQGFEEQVQRAPKSKLNEYIRQSLASIISPIDHLSPISTYQTSDEKGIMIASLIKIGKKQSNNK